MGHQVRFSDVLPFTIEQKPYWIEEVRGQIHVRPLHVQDPLYTEKVVATVIRLLEATDLAITQWNQNEELRSAPIFLQPEQSIAYATYDYIRKSRKTLRDTADRCEARALSFLFRKRLEPGRIEQLMNADPTHYLRFIQQNKLHYNFFNSGVMFEQINEPMIIVNRVRYRYQDLTQTPDGEEIIFSHDGIELFRTDRSYKLIRSYTCGTSGILSEGERLRGNTLAPFAQMGADQQYTVYVITSLNCLDRPVFTGSHAFLGLRNPQGEIVCVGSFVKNGYKNPDKYICIPQTKYALATTPIRINPAQGHRIQARIQGALMNRPGDGEPLQRNCTSFIREILEEHSMNLNSKYTIAQMTTIVFLSFFPKSFQKISRKILRSLPSGVAKFLYFFPPIYIFNLVFGIAYQIVRKYSGGLFESGVFNIFDLFFRPWEAKVDHPLRLRESQLRRRETIYSGTRGIEGDLPEYPFV